MPEPSRRTWRLDQDRPVAAPAGRPADAVVASRYALPVFVLAFGVALWQHWTVGLTADSVVGHLPLVLGDGLILLPVAAVALTAALAGRHRLRSDAAAFPIEAALTVLALSVLLIPAATVQAYVHTIYATGAGHHGADGLPAGGLGGLLAYGVGQALRAEPAVLLLALVAVALRHRAIPSIPETAIEPTGPRGWRSRTAVAGAALLVAGLTSVPGTGASAAAQGGGSCASSPQRVFDLYAIDVDIVLDRFGDHDPYGYMYVLADRLDEVRAEEAALLRASELDKDDPSARKVSVGLGQDAIQPLVIRARLGDCVVINLTNKLTQAPRNGFGNPVITQPGGVPAVSVDLAGVAYDAAAGNGGQAVGNTPSAVMAAPGSTRQYRYFLDPAMGEGARVFRSGGDSSQLTAHGLFGTLIAEPAGSRWFDPATGADRTDDRNWSNWEAMIRPTAGPAFREFTVIYHEVGDENFTIRRPLRENDEGIPIGADPGVPVGDQVRYGRSLPMIDGRDPTPTIPNEGGGGTNSYRPASRGINYRSEPFFRRLQLEAKRGSAAQQANKSLAYSSYTYGDPATPMPRSYLGEPTKTRVVHAGVEQLHVHHVHGGGTRWRLNPGADDTAMDAGLSKVPVQNARSIRLDSQTISPTETFNLEHECGAGGCQQAVGDFLYHCHISHHYIAGMWGLWRVFDTRQDGLAALPGAAPPAAGVDSAGLLGRTVEGKRVVLAAALTDSARQVALEQLVESALPPRGARWDTGDGPDPDDATVWNWEKGGTAEAPVYLGEPETDAVWANYRSAHPGTRPEILFNPVTGRPAYPMLRPHLGQRPPFSPNGHSGAPGVGETTTAKKPGALCPSTAPVRRYDITAVPVAVQSTARERDENGEIYVLNEDKADVQAGRKPVDPLVVRSNVGDCVAITFGSELKPAVQQKVNMHTHLVQFDPLASDGVVAGFAYEQSVFDANREKRTLQSVADPRRITVSTVGRLRPGVSIGVGVGRTGVEIRTITGIEGTTLLLDRELSNAHQAGEPVTVEFVQYRWFSDVDSGTVFWHDHVDAIKSWAHGLFAAHIVEPKGSTYHDPVTGAPARSGTIVDVVNRSGSVGVGQSGSFREFTVFLQNGRRGRQELASPPPAGLNPFNAGQECEEGTINLRAAPLGERIPPGATPADPATTDQRQEYNGGRCRNAFTRTDVPGNYDASTTRATVSTVDPYAFSSVKYGDPGTPLLRAYAGDPVVIRTIGVNDRAEALRVQGHRFRVERFAAAGQLTDTATTGVSERFDYVLDGGAGGPARQAGDYLYYSTRTFALESGAWGILRVHDRLRGDLRPLPGRSVPATGAGFPRQIAAPGNTQAEPGPDPAPAYLPDGKVNTAAVSGTADACPAGVRTTAYDISLIDHALPTAPFPDTGGVVYALTSDVAAIRAGTRPLEPLVLRANQGDCVRITLHNEVAADSRYGGTRAGLDLGKLLRNQQLAGGAAVGLNADTTVARGGSLTLSFFADRELGTTVFQNLGSTASLRHGAYGLLIVEPRGATWSDSRTGVPLGPRRTATQAIIRTPDGKKFREFALTMQSTDQQFSRSIQPYAEQVAGNGLNSTVAINVPPAPVPGAPPGTAQNKGTFDKGFNNLNYRSAPLTSRLGLTQFPDDFTKATVVGSYGTAFSSDPYGDPATPVLVAGEGDPVVFRVGIGASDQFHAFTVSGHSFPLEPRLRGSEVVTARTVTAGETLDAPVGPAGGGPGNTGDYLVADSRLPFAEAGMWGILRVLPRGTAGSPAPL
ncbi:hypothetical protein AB0C12_39265 [Actinoplanes sp. NPDC048967]|uniref:hypothetical protein n=1 Tax=Actinoplanes sp. NPDC048967 TaxID=3155269 RepID=UPI0033D48C2F